MRPYWIDLGEHRDAEIIIKEYAKRTEIRIDTKLERLEVRIGKHGGIRTRIISPIPREPAPPS